MRYHQHCSRRILHPWPIMCFIRSATWRTWLLRLRLWWLTTTAQRRLRRSFKVWKQSYRVRWWSHLFADIRCLMFQGNSEKRHRSVDRIIFIHWILIKPSNKIWKDVSLLLSSAFVSKCVSHNPFPAKSAGIRELALIHRLCFQGQKHPPMSGSWIGLFSMHASCTSLFVECWILI